MKYLIIIFLAVYPFKLDAQVKVYEELVKSENELSSDRDYTKLADKYIFLGEGYNYLDEDKSNYYWNKYYDLVSKKNDTLKICVYYYHKTIQYFYKQDYINAEKTAAV